MSLLTLAQGICADSTALHEENRTKNDLVGLQAAADALNRYSEATEDFAKSVWVLHGGGVAIEVLLPPAPALQNLRDLTPSPDGFADQPNQLATSAVRLLENWLRDQRDSSLRAFRDWANSMFPDLEGVETLASALGVKGVGIRRAINQAKSMVREVPETVEGLEDIRMKGVELRREVDDLVPEGEVRMFLSQVVSVHGASLSGLTGQFQDWAKTQGVWKYLRIQLSDTAED